MVSSYQKQKKPQHTKERRITRMAKKPTLSEARQARGCTQDVLAHSIGKQLSTVHNWERGRNIPSVADAQRASRVLGLSTDDIDWTSPYEAKHNK